MFDGKIDGKFIIGNGDSISQGIVDELGLTKDECKKISHSIWAQIFKEFDDPQNVNVSNNQNINPNSGNNYLVHKNAVIRLSKECWQKIVNLINTVLKKNIEIDNNDDIADNTQNVLHSTNDNNTDSKEELMNWYLTDEYYSSVSAKNNIKHNEQVAKKRQEWYQNYQKEKGPMNFYDAIKYLQDNPELDQDIQEYIKTAFGICDGDVSKNCQGGKGTCHLLACRDELDDSSELKNIVNNIVKQNSDGTVTVTFFGIIEDGKPLTFTLSNKEIYESYTINNLQNYISTTGSTDPDNAALELAYEKLAQKVSKKFKDIENKILSLQNQICFVALNNTYNNLLKTNPENPDLQNLLEYLKQNINDFNKMSWSEILDKMETDGQKDIFWDNIDISCDKIDELCKQVEETEKQKGTLLDKYGWYSNLQNYDENNLAKSLGGVPEITFKILTGKEAHNLNYNLPEGWYNQPNQEELYDNARKEAIDNFLSNTNIKSTPIVLTFKKNDKDLNIREQHAYSLKDIYIDKESNTKMIRIHNPHGYDVTLKYDDFLNSINSLTYLEL